MSAKAQLHYWTSAAREFITIGGPRTMKWGGLAVVSAIGVFLLDLAFALALQRFLAAIGLISAGAQSPLFGPLWPAWAEGCLFLGLGTLRVAGMWLNSFATGVCSVTFESTQRRDIGHWALSSGNASIGEFATLFNDIAVGSAAVASNVFYLASRVVLMTATLVALAVYSWQMTALIMAVVVVTMPLHRSIDTHLNRVSGVLQRSLAQSVDKLVSGIKNAVFLHIHGLVEQEERASRALIGSFERSSRSYYAYASARNAVPQILGLVVVAAIAVAGSTVFGDNPGTIVAYLYLTLRLFQSLTEIARVTANTRVNLARYNVLRAWRMAQAEVLKAMPISVKPFDRSQLPSEGPALGWQLCDVSFGWPGGPNLIDKLSIDIRPGTITVVVGPSGGGKTTLLLLLAGVLKATEGQILVQLPDGEESIETARGRIVNSIAYVGPDPFVVPGTLRQFLVFGLERTPSEEEIHEALRLAHCRFALDLGLQHRLSEQGEGLSAGQKQRLSLARALLRQPRALLLDEPTANLDQETESVLLSALSGFKGRCTIIAVTHGEAFRGLADTLLTIGDPRPVVLQMEEGAGV